MQGGDGIEELDDKPQVSVENRGEDIEFDDEWEVQRGTIAPGSFVEDLKETHGVEPAPEGTIALEGERGDLDSC